MGKIKEESSADAIKSKGKSSNGVLSIDRGSNRVRAAMQESFRRRRYAKIVKNAVFTMKTFLFVRFRRSKIHSHTRLFTLYQPISKYPIVSAATQIYD
jgi:hypothetical protein